MLKSMTAYGRSLKVSQKGRWVVEIHSINRKHLDLAIHLPKELLFLDLELRKWISQDIARGQVTVRIQFFPASQGIAPLGNWQKLKENWERLADELGYQKQAIDLPFLVSQMGNASYHQIDEEERSVQIEVKEIYLLALEQFMEMKRQEGKALFDDIAKRLEIIKLLLAQIEERSVGVGERYREKLQERVAQFFPLIDELKERAAKEVVLYAERADIAEEITRLSSHLAQFRSQLDLSAKSIGKTLDFLMQEMQREVNTLSAKSPDLKISSLAVEIKTELERVREQLQNVE